MDCGYLNLYTELMRVMLPSKVGVMMHEPWAYPCALASAEDGIVESPSLGGAEVPTQPATWCQMCEWRSRTRAPSRGWGSSSRGRSVTDSKSPATLFLPTTPRIYW